MFKIVTAPTSQEQFTGLWELLVNDYSQSLKDFVESGIEGAVVYADVRTFTEDERPWGPGERIVYNDEDMFILGVAMDRFLKRKEGPSASVLGMLTNEVFKPIGVHHFVTTTTYTEDGRSPGMPHFAWGCLPTLDDLVKIAGLLHNRGNHNGRQLLHKELCRTLFLEGNRRPLEGRYMMSTWYRDYTDDAGDTYKVPHMSGMGGNIVVLMPNKLTAIQLSNRNGVQTGMVSGADRVRPFAKARADRQ